MTVTRWDVFCKVVDNYGDAGVGWRLARQLASEHAIDVTLWLDEVAVLARIAPGVDPRSAEQRVAGVTLRRWVEPFPPVAPADVVVEAFGCGLPDAYLAAMSRKAPPPAWFVLEYLSAEGWVDGAHGLPSPHPRLPLPRRFWFPGFTPGTGGVLRERGLLDARDAFRRDVPATVAFWTALGIPPPASDEVRVSLFCYPNAALPALLDAWADGDVPVVCVVPEGVAAGALDRWTGGNVPHRGHPYARGRLALHAIPFVAQDAYDRLLWACGVNFVRGEDSFVRAQWAARPFAWHLYPQAEGAHCGKLDAFLDGYAPGLAPTAQAALRGFWKAWNAAPGAPAIGPAWVDFLAGRPQLEAHAEAWAARLASTPGLTAGLVKAVAGRV